MTITKMSPEEKEILDKWENLSMLDDVEEDKKLKLSLLFDELYNKAKNGEYDENRAIIIFPALRKIVNGIDVSEDVNLSDVFLSFIDFWEKNKQVIEDIYCPPGIDLEAEAIYCFSETYIEKLKNN